MSNVSPIHPKRERKVKSRPVPTNAVSVRKPEMMALLGIGSSKADELIRTGRVKSVLIGRTRLISVRSIEALLEGEAA